VPPGTMEKNAPMPLFNLTAGATVTRATTGSTSSGAAGSDEPSHRRHACNYSQQAVSPVNNAATATGRRTLTSSAIRGPRGVV